MASWIKLILYACWMITVSYTHVFLYDTETNDSMQYAYCIYWVTDTTLKYCVRENISVILNTTKDDDCYGNSQKWSFDDAVRQNILPNDVLMWSSSIESAEDYAAFYYGKRKLLEKKFLCNCSLPGTFGPRCEFEFFHETVTFEDAIKAQFEQKKDDESVMQRYGDILCYRTAFECDYGLMCLDWRNICDGEQQCMNGTDEENCDLLEFNECKDDEYRCVNGMCITEEYWLDGEFDCMDQSDENRNKNSKACPFTAGSIECEEQLCTPYEWSCGDGQCILGPYRLSYKRAVEEYCVNMREFNYMCEMHPKITLWTQPNGLCWDLDEYDDLLDMNNENMSNTSKCIYLIRCAMSQGFERDCPCNHLNCSFVMEDVCQKNYSYRYPMGNLLRPYIVLFYGWEHSIAHFEPESISFDGSIKCRGFYGNTEEHVSFHEEEWYKLDSFPRIDHLFCNHEEVTRDNKSHIQYHHSCWNGSRTLNNHSYAFIDICEKSHKCISQYRIGDEYVDCEEETHPIVVDGDYCSKLRKHRFQCSNQQVSCLPVRTLGDRWFDCKNRHDEFVGGSIMPLFDIECNYRLDDGCRLLKEYVATDGKINGTHSFSENQLEKRELSFLSYCDTFWNLPSHFDELLENCQEWVCQQDQYQCQTGHCIELDWLCDEEWDCPDASDEQAVELNLRRLHHNMHLENFQMHIRKCLDYSATEQSFGDICNVTLEYPCLLANVKKPLDINVSRPCINLTQIGDGEEDCYGGLDERNTLESCDGSMLGYTFRCPNQQCLNIESLCENQLSACKDEILCHHRRDTEQCSGKMDVTCFDNSCAENARCNGRHNCEYGEDEYWCSPNEYMGNMKYKYRHNKESQRRFKHLSLTIFPFQDQSSIKKSSSENVSKHSNMSSPIISMARIKTDIAHSYTCNRGIAIAYKGKDFVCFCPPSYYGKWCEYFSDHVTVITHFDLTSLPTFVQTNKFHWFKIVASLLYFERTIDFHEFEINSELELDNYMKHKFYLLYSISNEMQEKTRRRHFNRTDIINNHPYSVRFVIYQLESNQIVELGSWFYPIYFDFLPLFRLATVLKFPAWYGNVSMNPCSVNNTSCPSNSICRPVFNHEYPHFSCSCQSGFYGKNCEKFHAACSSYCSPNALCKPMDRGELTNTNNSLCICPLHHFGPRCYLFHAECLSHPCHNNGTCHLRNDPSGQRPFTCNCSANFHGEYCEKSKFTIQINLNITNHAVASIIQLYDVHPHDLHLLLQNQQVISGVPLSIRFHHTKTVAPSLAVLKLYDHSIQSKYYIIYIQENKISININSTPRHCPYAMSLPFLQNYTTKTAVFKYHRLCQVNRKLLCFHDDNYLCICEYNHIRVDCFGLDSSADQCNFCLSNGKCLRGDVKNQDDFLCICPKCSYGRRCEYTAYAFGFTLDSLLANDRLSIQIIYTCFVTFLFLFGLFTNLCSIVIFKRPQSRKVTVGIYLYIVSILNQCALFFLLFKFIHILGGFTWHYQLNLITCKMISYLLFVSTRATFWLTSWITLDRLQTILFPSSVLFKRPNIAIGISIITLIILGIMHIPNILYTTLIVDKCVINFEYSFMSMYNRTNTLLHYLGTFALQTIAITILIILVTRSREKVAGSDATFRQIFKIMFNTKKELYMTPIIIILSAIPQTILSFSLACSELSTWQRHTLLPAYLLSYAPQILGFILFVLPSKGYRMDFGKTKISQRFPLKWILNIESSQQMELTQIDNRKTKIYLN
ncbi:hypothetical protein I4U23_015310 [Adineta vaga]|nr:hypothetical protein I4U23_015310 [Adineta vaga]